VNIVVGGILFFIIAEVGRKTAFAEVEIAGLDTAGNGCCRYPEFIP